jgi:Flp pilus assembly protein TadD
MKRFASLLLSLFAVLSLSLPMCIADSATDEVKLQVKFGVRAAKEGHWDEAIYRWKKTVLLDPNNLMAHNNLAVAYEQMGEYDLAMEEYQTAYKLNSQNDAVKNNLDRFRDFYRKYQSRKK